MGFPCDMHTPFYVKYVRILFKFFSNWDNVHKNQGEKNRMNIIYLYYDEI